LTDDGLNAVNDINDDKNYQDSQRALKSRLDIIEREQLQKYKEIERLQEKWIESKKESKSNNDTDSEGGEMTSTTTQKTAKMMSTIQKAVTMLLALIQKTIEFTMLLSISILPIFKIFPTIFCDEIIYIKLLSK
jgi:hypothetical protein